MTMFHKAIYRIVFLLTITFFFASATSLHAQGVILPGGQVIAPGSNLAIIDTTCTFVDVDEAREICISYTETMQAHGASCVNLCTTSPRYKGCSPVRETSYCRIRTQSPRTTTDYSQQFGEGAVFWSEIKKDLRCQNEVGTQGCSLNGGTAPNGYNDSCKTKYADCLAGRIAKPEDNFKSKTDCDVYVNAQSNASLAPECADPAEGQSGDPRQICLQRKFEECTQACPECRGDVGGKPVRGAPTNYDGPIPNCAFTYSGCRNVNDLVQLLINIARIIFGIIGTLALVFFIYGGVTIILSFGSPEKLKKGKQILSAAVIGIAISFSAYLLVGFILDTLGVSKEFDFRQVANTLTSLLS